MLDDVGSYVDSWVGAAQMDDAFRSQADLHPDEVSYLTNSLYNLDMRLTDRGRPCPAKAVPTEGRVFHRDLVEALLFALAEEGPSQAAFADQLRPWWPVVDGTA